MVFLAVTPGVVAGLVPWVITGWRMAWRGGWVWPVAIAAALAILCGVVVLLDVFVRFARADGTPAPPMPTAHLVVVGPYRYVRNPMYLAVLSIILGQALLFRSGGTLLYAGTVLTTRTAPRGQRQAGATAVRGGPGLSPTVGLASR